MTEKPTRAARTRGAVLAAVALAAVMPPSLGRAQDALTRAREFLSQAQPGGAPVVDDVEGLRAMPAAAQRDAAVALFLAIPDNRQAAFARLAFLAGTPYSDSAAIQAAQAQLRSGVLGLAPDHAPPDPLVVVEALRFAAKGGAPDAVVGLLGMLAALQRVDGSFGFVDNDGDVSLTAEVARALVEVRLGGAADPIVARARAWLATRAAQGLASLPAADLGLLLLAGDGADATAVRTLLEALRARQEPSGAFDGGDLRGTALAIQGLRRGLPDLRVLRPAVDLAEAVTGEPHSRTAFVSNVGLTESPPTRLDFSVLVGGTVRSSGAATVPAVAPGATVSVTLELGVQGAPADAVLQIVANPAADFAEAELDKNVLAFPFRIQDLPDLAVAPGGIAVVPDPPAIHEANRVSVRVANVGEATARNVLVQVYAGEPGAGGQLVDEIVLSAVAAGTPRIFTASWTPRSPEPVRLWVRVDSSGAIRERDETNNASSIEARPENPAELHVDLRAEAMLTPSGGVVPTSFVQGEKAAITYSIGGWIRRFSNPYPYDVLWPFGGVTVLVYQGVPGAPGVVLDRRVLKPFVRCNLGGAGPYCGDVTSEPVVVPLPRDATAGVHPITIVVDPDHLIPDEDRANDARTIDVSITNAGHPELFVETMEADRYSVSRTRPSTLSARVFNSGVADAVAVPYTVTFPTRVVTGTIPYLAAGGGYAITQAVGFDDLTPDWPFNHTITLRIDPDGVVSESTKSNNSASVVMSQGIGDVRIDAISQRVRPAPAGTSTTPVDLTIFNDTIEATAWIQVSAGGVSVSDRVPLEPGAPRIVTLDIPTKGLKGPQELSARVLAQSASAQWASTTRSFVLDVGNADLAVSGSAITLDPELPASGQPVTATVLVSNLGNVEAETSVRLYRGYPEHGELVSSGRVTVRAGGTAAFVGTPFVPRQEAPWVITAVVDEEDAWTELDDRFNNWATRNTLKQPGRIAVLFEEIHRSQSTVGDDPAFSTAGYPGNLGDFARDLVARGYDVKAVGPDAGLLGPAHLRGVDVLLTFASSTEYRPEELRLLRDYVERGGGYFYLGDRRNPDPAMITPWGPAEDQIARTFGFVSNRDLAIPRGVPCIVVFQGYTKANGDIRDHVITTGVSSLITAWGGTFGDALPPAAEVLIRSPASWSDSPSAVISAVFPVGQGRMGIIGDANILDADSTPPSSCGMGIPYYSGSNARFGLQMVDWLARGGLRDWKPDLAFVPSRLELSRTVIDAGDLVTVLTTVRNVGGAIGEAGETTVRLYDGDPAAGNLVAEQVVPALGIDQGHQVAFTWDTSRASGHHVLTAVVDADDRIDEFAEDNNRVALTVDVRRDIDLRIDPSDVVVTPGDPPLVTVRVHNLGYTAAPAGARLDLFVVGGTAESAGRVWARAPAPSIPPRGAVTVTVPWAGEFPGAAFDLRVTVAPPEGKADPDLSTNEARRHFEPPELTLHTPYAGTRWGGRKSVRFSASSLTRAALTCGVAVAPSGGPFAGLMGTACDAREIDTVQYPDGDYVVQVTADDGLQRTVREVPIRIANDGLAVRTFDPAPGSATTLLSPPRSTATIALPVGSRVTSATAVVVPARVASSAFRPTPAWDYEGAVVVRHRAALHVFTVVSGILVAQVSDDEGASWSGDLQLASGVFHKAAAVNSAGLHLVYSTTGGTWYRRSEDGTAWSPPVQIATQNPLSLTLRATDEGVALVSADYYVAVSVANADGSGWGPFVRHVGWECDWTDAAVRDRKLHLLYSNGRSGTLYRSVALDRYADQSAYSAPVQVAEPGNSGRGALFTSTEILVSRLTYLSDFSVQRCPLARDCTSRDAWLPEAAVAAPYRPYDGPHVWFAEGRDDTIRMLKTGPVISHGGQGGAVWSGEAWLAGRLPGSTTVLLERDTVSVAGADSTLWRLPGFAPTDVALGVGADGAQETATIGMLNAPVQSADLGAALNAHLASHLDADDGAVDGRITVSLVFTGGGAGQVQLADLEVVYVSESSVAGLAEPPVFSPVASPGVLDSASLSVSAGSSISVADAAGASRRVLATAAAGGRSVSVFDGRDDAGNALPSGRYSFGVSGGPAVAEVEIDDLPPAVSLRSPADGSYGGLAQILGSATDIDWAGTPKNFARYLLEYTRDGSTWTRIAASSSPVDGVLGNWDARRLPAGTATLRLTAWDRAGNSATISRVFGVSPGTPLAPVIDTPTVAGRPLDSLTPAVTVGGTAEPGATVTVLVDSVAVGTAASDGRWAVQGIQLPNGTSTISARAERRGQISPSSQPIQVTRYGLTVALDLPSSAPGEIPVSGAIVLARASTAGGPVTVRLSARDATGAAANVQLTPVEQRVTMQPCGAASVPFQLGGPIVRAGTYTIRAEVVSGGLVPASAERPITLEPTRTVVAALVSDKANYGSDQVVGLQARLLNPGTAPTGELQATLHVVARGGEVTTLGPYAVTSIRAGGAATLGALFGNPPLTLGAYAAEVVVLDAWSNVVASASTTFEVRDGGAAALAGRLLVSPTTYQVGVTLQADWSISNDGAETSAEVSVVLLRAADSLVFSRWDRWSVLAGGSTTSGGAALSTTAADGQEIVAILLANGRGLAAQAVPAALVPDLSAPVITITGFSEGEYRAGPVTPEVTITDASRFTEDTRLSGVPFTSGTQVVADGDYVVSVDAADMWGNRSTARRGFTIDTVPPVIAITGVMEGALTNTLVTPDVRITELHPGAQRMLLDGVPWTNEPVADEGDHVLAVNAQDLAGNQADARVAFAVDRTPPAISVGGVTDGALYGAAVEPVVAVTDMHPGTPAWTATLNGVAWTGAPVAEDGDWTFSVAAGDAAGNDAAPVLVQFAIDTLPPVIRVSGVTEGLLTREVVTPLISIEERHPGDSAVALDGAPFVSGTPIVTEGPHQLVVSATDALGHAAAPVTVRFTRDARPPDITILGIVEGAVYPVEVWPSYAAADDFGVATLAATLDGQPFASGARVATAGAHSLAVTATDRAGNTAVRTVAFTIGGTQADLSAVLDGSPRVLVALDCPREWHDDEDGDHEDGDHEDGDHEDGDHEDGDHEDGGGHRDERRRCDDAGDEHRVGDDRGQPRRERPGEGPVRCRGSELSSCAKTRARVLLAALEGASIPYDVATSGSEFLRELRRNAHNVRILYRSRPPSTDALGELRELSFGGGGLVVVNDASADADPKLKDVLGVGMSGRLESLGAISIAAGDLGPGRTLSVAGSGIAQRILSSTAVPVGRSGSSAVVTTNRYGAGRAVTLTFDPEATDTPDVRGLLVKVVQFAAGGVPPVPVAGAPQYVKLTSSLGAPPGPVDARLEAWTAAGLSPLTEAGAPTVPPRAWTYSLTAGAPVSRSLGVTARVPGTYAVLGELGLQVGGANVLVAQAAVDVTIGGTAQALKAQAMDAVEAIPDSTKCGGAKVAARNALADLCASPTTRRSCEQAISSAVRAADALSTINGTEALAARSRVDQLLRALQVLQATLP